MFCAEDYKCYHDDLSATGNGFTTATPAGKECADNEICPTGTSVPTYCEPGTYTDLTGRTAGTALVENTHCLDCPADYFCPDYGITDATGVNPYNAAKYECLPGYLCNGKAVHPSNRDDQTVAFCP